MMMFYSKTPPKVHFKEEEILPWNADENNVLNFIMESPDLRTKRHKIINRQAHSEPKRTHNHNSKEGHSYNFYTNLRKYEKRKADDFMSKKEVNFIEKNIKGVSQDFSNYQEHSPQSLINQMIKDKREKCRNLHSQYSSTIEPINWNQITQFQQNKIEKRHRFKGFQNFIKFQQQSHGKDSFKQLIDNQTFEDEQSCKASPNKYQKLLKMREGLRKRNLRSSDETHRRLGNTLSIQQYGKGSKITKKLKNGSTQTPKTSHSMKRNCASDKMGISKYEKYMSTSEPVKVNISKPYTSHQNRIKLPVKFSIE